MLYATNSGQHRTNTKMSPPRERMKLQLDGNKKKVVMAAVFVLTNSVLLFPPVLCNIGSFESEGSAFVDHFKRSGLLSG